MYSSAQTLLKSALPVSSKLSLSCAVISHSVVYDSATPWPTAHQAPLFMGFSRQEYWSGLLFPLPGDLHNPGIEPRSRRSSVSPALAGAFFTTSPTWEVQKYQLLSAEHLLCGKLNHYWWS